MTIKKDEIKKRFDKHVEKHIDSALDDEARWHARKVVREAIEPPAEKKERLAREARYKAQDEAVAAPSSIAKAPAPAVSPKGDHPDSGSQSLDAGPRVNDGVVLMPVEHLNELRVALHPLTMGKAEVVHAMGRANEIDPSALSLSEIQELDLSKVTLQPNPYVGKLVKWPSAILSTPTSPVENIAGHPFLREVERKLRAVLDPLHGYALAAPQAGFQISMVVTKGPHLKEETWLNPRILRMGPKRKVREGCLSTPGYFMDVDRAAVCTLEFFDMDGTRHERSLKGIEAQVAQHETDHCNGKMIVDSLPPLRRKRLAAQLVGQQFATTKKGNSSP